MRSGVAEVLTAADVACGAVAPWSFFSRPSTTDDALVDPSDDDDNAEDREVLRERERDDRPNAAGDVAKVGPLLLVAEEPLVELRNAVMPKKRGGVRLGGVSLATRLVAALGEACPAFSML